MPLKQNAAGGGPENTSPLQPTSQKSLRSPIAGACALILLACAACSSAGDVRATRSEHAPPASPTNLPTSAQRSETSTPFAHITPGLVYEGGIFEPEPSPTPIPVVLPPEDLIILEPGDGSQVTSPFQVRGYVRSSEYREVTVRLLDAGGEALVDKTARLRAIGDQPFFFITSLEFEIATVADSARLEVRSTDRPGGLIDHLASVRLTLLSIGPGEVHPVIPGPERLTIMEPQSGSTLSPTDIAVRGTAWADSWAPLDLRLWSPGGQLLDQGGAALHAPGLGELGMYEASLNLELSAPTEARLLVCETTPDLLQLVHCSSAALSFRP